MASLNKLILLGVSSFAIVTATSCQKPVVDKVMLYGNVITLDEKGTKAEAVGTDIKTGKIYFIGSRDEAKKLINNQTEEINYGNKYIYPGFVDAHNHPGLLGSALAGGCYCSTEDDREKVFEKLNAYIKDNPNLEFYKAYGAFVAPKNSQHPNMHYTYKLIDENVHTNKPVLIGDYSGHSACINGAALAILREYLKVTKSDEDFAKDIKADKMTDTIELEDLGRGFEEVNGIIAESPYYLIYLSIPIDRESLKEGILLEQENLLKYGYTTLGDCSVKCDNIETMQVLSELGKEGKLKFKIRGFFSILESENLSAKKQVNRVLKFKEQYDNEYFKIVGLKFFKDGISEKETCNTLEPYHNNPFPEEFPEEKGGYRGVDRWHAKWRPIMPEAPSLSDLIKEANTHGLSVTVHSFGDKAVNDVLNAYEEAGTSKTFARNSISHCAYVVDSDIPRFKELNVTPLVAPHWSYREKAADTHDINVFGDYDPSKPNERSLQKMYKINSFLKNGGRAAFHTDGMCPEGVPYMLYTALNRVDPHNADPNAVGYIGPRDENEDVTIEQALECSTKTPAYLLGEENNIGSIEIGKCGDFSIYDVDLTDKNNFDQENYKIAYQTPVIATYLNGKIAYEAK